MNLVWKETFKVHTYDVDFNNKIKISTIFNYMQECATNHAGHLNIGFNKLSNEKSFWVLSRAQINILDYPKKGDEVLVETWSKGADKIFALRDFKIYNNKKEIIAKATTAWLIVDIQSMRPQRPNFMGDKNYSLENEYAIEKVPGKISQIDSKKLIFEKNVSYSDIDINQHVNNVKYVELAIDSFSKDRFLEKHMKEFQINFLSECKYGQVIQVHKGYDQLKDISYIEGVRKDKGDKVFQATVKWD